MKLPRVLAAAGVRPPLTALAQTTAAPLTWADYAADAADFKKETGIDVEVTLSNNEEMISKLRATGGAGFDLAQPSQDRIAGPQQEFGIYKPLDLTKIKAELFIPSMLESTKKNTRRRQVYGLPHIWGTDGLVVDTRQMGRDYTTCKPLRQDRAPEAADADRSRSRAARTRSRRSKGLPADGRRRGTRQTSFLLGQDSS
jgi:spermidine/putrescine transport system substrate-binding protein